ncbi:hypothetical protein JTB14_016912, partial [Gonioctena quinquepunctata]
SFYKDSEKEPTRDEEIEMANLENTGQELIPAKEWKFGCFGILKKTWSKFTETKELDPDDLDSLDLYYLSEYTI